jgi:hypothetical protein
MRKRPRRKDSPSHRPATRAPPKTPCAAVFRHHAQPARKQNTQKRITPAIARSEACAARPLVFGAREAPHAARPSARQISSAACPEAKRAKSLGRPDHDQRSRLGLRELTEQAHAISPDGDSGQAPQKPATPEIPRLRNLPASPQPQPNPHSRVERNQHTQPARGRDVIHDFVDAQLDAFLLVHEVAHVPA